MKRVNKWLLAIVVLGAILRFFRLGVNPPGLYWDEVSLGWNAYSVLKTGMDEHGRFLPIDTFFAFGDYKPPLYIYAVVPSVWLFGLNEFAVRFPSALAGTGLIVVTYFLVKILLRSDLGVRQGRTFSDRIALVSAFLVAISPWSITLSRVGFESNLAVLLNALGVLFFLYAVYRSARWLPVSVLSFALAAYTFNANRVLSPLFLVAFSLVYYKKVVKEWKWWLAGGVLAAVLALPTVPHLRSSEGKLRWNEVNIFSDLGPILTVNERRERAGNTLLARVWHHRYWEYGKLFLSHYLDHFDLRYLFVDGDPNPRISVGGVGQLYLIELPFLAMGIVILISQIRPIGQIRQIGAREKALLFLWALLAAVPAGMARETPHALRSASTLPVPQIIVAMGGVWFISRIRQIRLIWLIWLIGLIMILSLVHFQFIYWRYYPKEWAGVWLTAYKPLVQYIKQEEKNFKTIYVTPDLGRPYIYFLFYGDYSPENYIQEAKAGGRTGDAFGFFNVQSFGKYRFYVPDLNTISDSALVVTRADPPPPGFSLVKTIIDVNDHPEFNVIEKQ
jgi:4-amino-4-deoxy-L-arabinose transferase-like glycosyltransferase